MRVMGDYDDGYDDDDDCGNSGWPFVALLALLALRGPTHSPQCTSLIRIIYQHPTVSSNTKSALPYQLYPELQGLSCRTLWFSCECVDRGNLG